MTNFFLAFRWAARELRSGLSGFRIFLACLILGVAAIAGVGSLAQAFLTGLSDEGRTLLGGDATVGIVHRPASAVERRFLEKRGRVSETVSMRAMAYALKDGVEQERELVELKAVDDAYPLVGVVRLSGSGSLARALSCTREICGAVAEQTLLDRLHVTMGDTIRLGAANFRVTAVLQKEPDRISGGFSLGPRLMIASAALPRTQLVVVGSLINYTYRLAALAPFSSSQFKSDALKAFPNAGWEIRDPSEAAPGLRRFVEQVTMFLTLVGLTALAVAGLGAQQSVAAFLDRKRNEIATFKALGAEGNFIFLVFFLQVMAIALLASTIGIAVGAGLPFLVEHLYGQDIPAPAHYGVFFAPLFMAATFGLLSAIAFAVPPLARAREIAPANLFRDAVRRARGHGRWPFLALAAGAGVAVVALSLSIAPSPMFSLHFFGGVVIGISLLWLVAEALRFGLHHSPRPRRAELRLALANLTRPNSTTTAVIMALGLGLTLLAAVSLLDRTISYQIADRLPQNAPSFFFVDIQPDQAAAFDALIHHTRGASDYQRTPMIRGRIIALNGTPSAEARVASDARWVLDGDRGITYAATPPKGTAIVEGRWWPANYRGDTLISFDAKLAEGLGLKLGDTMTLNVLGRAITGRIASLRKVDFSTGGQNFLLVLSPGLIDKAPHSFLATVRVDDTEEARLYRSVTDRFPNVSTVRVKEAIAEVNALLQQLGLGVRMASLITILAGLLVLAGAIAAGQRARLYDATVFKVLGATRARIAAVYAIEYGLIGIITGVIALAAGSLCAYIISNQVLNVAFIFDPVIALATVFGGGLATLLFGMIAAWAALSARPAQLLRAP